jgi:hypothetical protein
MILSLIFAPEWAEKDFENFKSQFQNTYIVLSTYLCKMIIFMCLKAYILPTAHS